MKKLFIIFSACVLAATACTAHYMDYNTNQNNATTEMMQREDYISTGTLLTMQDWVVAQPDDGRRFQFLEVLSTGTMNGYFAIVKGGWTTTFCNYNVSDDWSASPFQELPDIYGAHLLLRSNATDPIPLAVANIMEVAKFSKIADCYGPIPYSKMGKDGSLTCPYDSMEDLYQEFIDTLSAAINTLTDLQTSKLSSVADKVYGGDLVKWCRYANSLKLRLAIHMAYVDPAKAQKYCEEVAAHPIGAIQSVADQPYYVQSVRNRYRKLCLEWGDYRICADIICYMNGYNDPRRPKYFQLKGESGDDCAMNDKITCDGYIGWRTGVNPSDAAKGAGLTNIKAGPNDPTAWMSASESSFCFAEAALRGWNVGKTAKEYYEQGVRLSFEQWGATGADAYLADNASLPQAYTDPTGSGYNGNYDCHVSPAWDTMADFESNLERIITQKWIANWRAEGVESWTEYRRTGYPRLLPVPSNLSGGVVPQGDHARRLPYPISERNSNTENYNEAVGFLGGPDTMGTPLWWDCKNK